jgi:hypothetical protein
MKPRSQAWGRDRGSVWATFSKVERRPPFCFDNGAIVSFRSCDISAIRALHQHHNQHLFLAIKGPVRIQPDTERTLALASWPKGTCMGETFLLLSCGAAFLTGLGIAAVSLFG